MKFEIETDGRYVEKKQKNITKIVDIVCVEWILHIQSDSILGNCHVTYWIHIVLHVL